MKVQRIKVKRLAGSSKVQQIEKLPVLYASSSTQMHISILNNPPPNTIYPLVPVFIRFFQQLRKLFNQSHP